MRQSEEHVELKILKGNTSDKLCRFINLPLLDLYQTDERENWTHRQSQIISKCPSHKFKLFLCESNWKKKILQSHQHWNVKNWSGWNWGHFTELTEWLTRSQTLTRNVGFYFPQKTRSSLVFGHSFNFLTIQGYELALPCPSTHRDNAAVANICRVNTGRFYKGMMDSHLHTNNQLSNKTFWKQNHSTSAWKLGLTSKSQYTHKSNIRHYWDKANWKIKHTGQFLKTQRGSGTERLCRWCSGGKQGWKHRSSSD